MQPNLLSVKTMVTEIATVVVNLIRDTLWSIKGRNLECYYLFSLFFNYQLEYLKNKFLDEINFYFLDYSI